MKCRQISREKMERGKAVRLLITIGDRARTEIEAISEGVTGAGARHEGGFINLSAEKWTKRTADRYFLIKNNIFAL